MIWWIIRLAGFCWDYCLSIVVDAFYLMFNAFFVEKLMLKNCIVKDFSIKNVLYKNLIKLKKKIHLQLRWSRNSLFKYYKWWKQIIKTFIIDKFTSLVAITAAERDVYLALTSNVPHRPPPLAEIYLIEHNSGALCTRRE